MRKIDRCIAKGIVAPLAAVYAAAIGTIGAILFQAGAHGQLPNSDPGRRPAWSAFGSRSRQARYWPAIVIWPTRSISRCWI